MADVFEVLARDHAEVKWMLAELERSPASATGATADQLLLRKKTAGQLVIEESGHEALEEMYFWPAVRERVPGGGALADEAVAQEQQGKEDLAELEKADVSDPHFEQALFAFTRAARAHIRFEEETVWPLARVAFPAAVAAELGTMIAEGKKTTVADKARDVVTRRGD